MLPRLPSSDFRHVFETIPLNLVGVVGLMVQELRVRV